MFNLENITAMLMYSWTKRKKKKLLLDPFNLIGDDIQRFVPADADVAGFATLLGIARSIWIEIYSLHRIEDPVA